MKFTLAVASLMAAAVSANPFAPAKSANSAKVAYMNNLLSKARPTANSQLKGTRRLEQNNNQNQNNQNQEEYLVDVSGYSLKFEQCQFVKTYSDELAEDEESSTVLATKRFVIFRMCPTGYCDTCSTNFGEYIVDLDDYLQATVEYHQQEQEEMCNACQECGNWQNGQDQQQDNQNQDGQQDNQNQDGGRRLEQQANNYNANVDCDSCYDECMKIQNMEENGYIDATNFLECQMIYDPEDDGKAALYAGPMCASGGSKIKIGVFEDENCYVPNLDKDVDDYLINGDGYALKLSHALLKNVYSSDCISCAMVDENANNNNNNNQQDQNGDQVLDMCQNLYESAAKCEKTNGFDNGYSNYYEYDNQLAQEGVVCDFVDSLKAGSYDQYGEIVVHGASSSTGGGSDTTGGQKFALTFFVLGTIGLAGYAAVLHSKLTKGGSSGLAESSGALA